jgi:hypothetical protein
MEINFGIFDLLNRTPIVYLETLEQVHAELWSPERKINHWTSVIRDYKNNITIDTQRFLETWSEGKRPNDLLYFCDDPAEQ